MDIVGYQGDCLQTFKYNPIEEVKFPVILSEQVCKATKFPSVSPNMPA